MITPLKLGWLVGNPDVIAEFKDGHWAPAYDKYNPERYEKFTTHALKQHLEKERILGTYIVWGDKARTLVLDFDTGDKAEDEARSAMKALQELGVPTESMALEFSGKKGYHVWVPTMDYVSASILRRLGRAALAIAGLEAEVFPKQDKVEEGGLGNLVKLPEGKHPTSGNDNPLLDPFPRPLTSTTLRDIVTQLPQEVVHVQEYDAPPPLQCLAAIQSGGLGEGGRNNALFHLAAWLRRQSLDSRWVETVVRGTNQGFNPPLSDDEVSQLLRSSANRGPICNSLPKELQCEDCPVRRPKGLHENPGQVRFGGQGELAVVRIGKRRANGVVELSHPDIEHAVVQLKKGR